MKKKLLNLLKKEAFFKEKVKLSSGKMSTFYIDVRRVSLSSEGIYLISRLFWQAIKNENITAIGGPTLGADPIVAGVCFLAHQERKKLKGFLVRKASKKYGRKKAIEGVELTSQDSVVIVDDVATTGSSLMNAIKKVEKTGAKIKKVIVLVDREEGAKETLLKEGYHLFSFFTKKDFFS